MSYPLISEAPPACRARWSGAGGRGAALVWQARLRVYRALDNTRASRDLRSVPAVRARRVPLARSVGGGTVGDGWRGGAQENHDEDPEMRILTAAEGPAAAAVKKGVSASRKVCAAAWSEPLQRSVCVCGLVPAASWNTPPRIKRAGTRGGEVIRSPSDLMPCWQNHPVSWPSRAATKEAPVRRASK